MDQDATSTEVNLGPGDIVLHGVAAPPQGGTAPSFRFMSIVAKRLDWMDKDNTWCRSIDFCPGHIVLDGVPALRKRGTETPPPPPLFGPCLLWPRSRISATAELVLKCYVFLHLYHIVN